MDCKNHQGTEATDRCAGCAEPFCENCLVNVGGQNYCGGCKQMAVAGAPAVEAITETCKEAKDALTYALIGIFCFGVILGPVAISKAVKAKKLINANPRLGGSGMATAGMVIGILDLVFWVLGVAARVSQM